MFRVEGRCKVLENLQDSASSQCDCTTLVSLINAQVRRPVDSRGGGTVAPNRNGCDIRSASRTTCRNLSYHNPSGKQSIQYSVFEGPLTLGETSPAPSRDAISHSLWCDTHCPAISQEALLRACSSSPWSVSRGSHRIVKMERPTRDLAGRPIADPSHRAGALPSPLDPRCGCRCL